MLRDPHILPHFAHRATQGHAGPWAHGTPRRATAGNVGTKKRPAVWRAVCVVACGVIFDKLAGGQRSKAGHAGPALAGLVQRTQDAPPRGVCLFPSVC